MPYQIPHETIHELQISLRHEANIPSYDPTQQPFPVLPPLEHSISEVDPSPPDLRCKHCKGRLIRGIKSLFCVFCGKDQFGEILPDAINFRSTTGYRWLLDSLQLDGSEKVELISEVTNSNRGQRAPKNEIPLSDLLNLEIPWHSKIEKPKNTVEDDWFQENPRSNSGLTNISMDPAKSSPGNTDVWFQQNQLQSGSKNLNHAKNVDKNDGSIDAWDDFTSSTGQKARPGNSSREESSGTNLFSPASDAQEQPDLFSARLDSRTDPQNLNDRNFTEVANGEVETIISQRHDLSVMLDSNLSVPQSSGVSKS